MDISQIVRIKNYDLFAKSIGLPGIPTKAQNGFCNGDAFLWAFEFKHGRGHEFIKECEDIASLTAEDINACVHGHAEYLAKALELKKKGKSINSIADHLKNDHKKYLNISSSLEKRLFFFMPSMVDFSMHQVDMDAAANLALGAIIHTPKGEIEFNEDIRMEREFDFSYVFDNDELAETLKRCIQPNKIIMIRSDRHATSLVYDGGRYHYFDPNQGEIICEDINELCSQIHFAMSELKESLSDLEDLDLAKKEKIRIPISISIIDYAKNKKNDYPSLAELIDLIQSNRSAQEGIDFPTPDGQTALILASSTKNPELVQELLQRGADPNAKTSDNRCALHAAAANGDIDSVRLLLSSGTNPNVEGSGRPSPLMIGAIANNPEVVEALLDKGANIDALAYDKNVYDISALNLAIAAGATEAAKMLINRGANLNWMGSDKILPIISASKSQKEVFFAILEKDPTQIKATYPLNGSNLYHFAAQSTFGLSIFDYLKKHYPHPEFPNIKNDKSDTPLFFACHTGNTEYIRYLISNKADINSQNILGKTPLMIACASGNIETVKLLLSEGCDPHLLDKNNKNFIDYAVTNEDVLRYLITNAYVDLTRPNANNQTLLYKAVEEGKSGVIKFLIEEMNALTYEDKLADAPKNLLTAAVKTNNSLLLKLLVQNGWPIHLKDCQGDLNDNLLHYAIKLGKKQIITTLLDLGADPYESNADGLNAYNLSLKVMGEADINAKENAKEICQLLSNRGLTRPKPRETNLRKNVLIYKDKDTDTQTKSKGSFHTSSTQPPKQSTGDSSKVKMLLENLKKKKANKSTENTGEALYKQDKPKHS